LADNPSVSSTGQPSPFSSWHRHTAVYEDDQKRTNNSPGGDSAGGQSLRINTSKTVIGVYMFSGLCASIAAVFISSRMMTAMPELGNGSEWMSSRLRLGGTSLLGGFGDYGNVLGALFMALIKNVDSQDGNIALVQPIVIGGIIVITVLVDVSQKKLADKLATKAAPQTDRRERSGGGVRRRNHGNQRRKRRDPPRVLGESRSPTRGPPSSIRGFFDTKGEVHSLVGENGRESRL